MKKPAKDAPREEHRLYAYRAGYFWMPCPRCGRFWGGHEEPSGRIMLSISTGTMTCCPGPEDAVITPERQAAIERARDLMHRGFYGDE